MTDSAAAHAPPDLTKYVEGVQFPASRQDLLDRARQNGASDDMLAALGKLRDVEYDNITEVVHALGPAANE